MKDEDFEKIMDAWASYEAKPAPGDKKGENCALREKCIG